MEFESFNYFMVEANTEFGETELHCTPDNTELYLHSEEYEEVDHIFHRINPVERRLGGFIWKHVLPEDEWETITEAMIESGNWIVMYRPEPTDTDMANYARDVVDIPDELPDDFK